MLLLLLVVVQLYTPTMNDFNELSKCFVSLGRTAMAATTAVVVVGFIGNTDMKSVTSNH